MFYWKCLMTLLICQIKIIQEILRALGFFVLTLVALYPLIIMEVIVMLY